MKSQKNKRERYGTCGSGDGWNFVEVLSLSWMDTEDLEPRSVGVSQEGASSQVAALRRVQLAGRWSEASRTNPQAWEGWTPEQGGM